MATDWKLIRELMNAAIDACEAAEGLRLQEEDRGQPTGTDEVVVWDVLTTAWTYPENTRYAVVRARHELADDVPYRPELARVIQEVAGVCAEVVGASKLDVPLRHPGGIEEGTSIRRMVERLTRWYPSQMIPQLGRAAAGRSIPDSPPA